MWAASVGSTSARRSGGIVMRLCAATGAAIATAMPRAMKAAANERVELTCVLPPRLARRRRRWLTRRRRRCGLFLVARVTRFREAPTIGDPHLDGRIGLVAWMHARFPAGALGRLSANPRMVPPGPPRSEWQESGEDQGSIR